LQCIDLRLGDCVSGSAMQELAKTIRLAPQSQSINLSLEDCDHRATAVIVAALRAASDRSSFSISECITNAQVALVCEAIRHAPALESISLDWEYLRDGEMQLLADSIRLAPVLHHVDFSFGGLSDDNLKILSEAIRYAPTLRSISLSFPGFSCPSDDAMKCLSDAVRHSPAVAGFNLCGFDGDWSIFDCLERCKVTSSNDFRALNPSFVTYC